MCSRFVPARVLVTVFVLGHLAGCTVPAPTSEQDAPPPTGDAPPATGDAPPATADAPPASGDAAADAPPDVDASPATQNIGWYDDFGTASFLGSGYVTGFQIQVGSASRLLRFGAIGKEVGARMKVGLYTDADGAPSALVASSDAFDLPNGRIEVMPSAGEVSLAAGNYWLATAVDATVNVGTSENVDMVIHYADVAFSEAMTDPFPPSPTATTAAFNLYIVVAPE